MMSTKESRQGQEKEKEKKKEKEADKVRAPKSMADKLADRVERAKSVALNKEISMYARQKNLTSAIECFQTAQERGWLNSHTFSGIINAHIRCGDMEGAEKVSSVGSTRRVNEHCML